MLQNTLLCKYVCIHINTHIHAHICVYEEREKMKGQVRLEVDEVRVNINWYFTYFSFNLHNRGVKLAQNILNHSSSQNFWAIEMRYKPRQLDFRAQALWPLPFLFSKVYFQRYFNQWFSHWSLANAKLIIDDLWVLTSFIYKVD